MNVGNGILDVSASDKATLNGDGNIANMNAGTSLTTNGHNVWTNARADDQITALLARCFDYNFPRFAVVRNA